MQGRAGPLRCSGVCAVLRLARVVHVQVAAGPAAVLLFSQVAGQGAQPSGDVLIAEEFPPVRARVLEAHCGDKPIEQDLVQSAAGSPISVSGQVSGW